MFHEVMCLHRCQYAPWADDGHNREEGTNGAALEETEREEEAVTERLQQRVFQIRGIRSEHAHKPCTGLHRLQEHAWAGMVATAQRAQRK